MQHAEISEVELREGERRCLQCARTKPLLAFSRHKGKIGERKNLCRECERSKLQERYCRLATQRETWQQQQEREERKRQAWERRVALRQGQEQRQREREHWYLQQPDRRCRTCRQLLPASAFGGVYSANDFILHTRCRICHEALRERLRLACCFCQEKTPRRDFLAQYDGYALCEIRYVGRTSRPKRRHAQHLGDVSPIAGQWGAERKAWYTRSNWMHALSERGLVPSMQILQHIGVSPLVVEWEQRYIWHGMQQGWKLLNVETMDGDLVARVRASPLDFLQVPFEMLVQQHFFSAHGLVAFLHKWYQ